MIGKISKIFNRILLKRKYKRLNVIVEKNVSYDEKTIFEGKSRVCRDTKINGTYLGLGSYIGQNCDIKGTKVGRFCSIAPEVKIIYGKHSVREFVSTHPAFYSLGKQSGFTLVDKQLFTEHTLADGKNNVIIGNDVWIGYGTRIIEGVTIGDGAVIGANSLVTKDVEPYSINFGLPAKKVGYRFEQEKVNKLLKINWWDKDLEWLKNNSKEFGDLDTFINKFEVR